MWLLIPQFSVKGNVWLITYGTITQGGLSLWHTDSCAEVGNLVTDTMLVIMPFPVLFAVKTRWQKSVYNPCSWILH